MHLYDKLCQVLLNHKLLSDELGLLHVLPQVTELPEEAQVFYPLIALEGKLGLGYASLVPLLKEAHERFVLMDHDENKDIAAFEQVTRIMIILKPENYTAMNRRKNMIINGYIDEKKELELIQLIFTIPKHAKSGVAWHHRQWILERMGDIDIPNELDLCRRACSIYPKNYHAWTYRSWLISVKCPEDEYLTSRHWVELNISDYSGVQHLQRVMELTSVDILEHTQWLDTLIKRYPGHESLWCHKRFCSHLAIRVLDDAGAYCQQQHRFVKDVQNDCFLSEALNEDAQVVQKELALKFGAWQAFLEKKSGISMDFSDYQHVAPLPFLTTIDRDH